MVSGAGVFFGTSRASYSGLKTREFVNYYQGAASSLPRGYREGCGLENID